MNVMSNNKLPVDSQPNVCNSWGLPNMGGNT